MLFVDTGVWYAALDRSDRSHTTATAVLAGTERLVTSEFVLVEAWRLVAYRLGYEVAERFWDGLRTGMARVESVTAGDQTAAWTIGLAYPDQQFSLVDRTSFAVMERMGIDRVATFDSDFAVYRYGADRSKAFVIER